MVKIFLISFLALTLTLSSQPQKLFGGEIQFDVEGKISEPEKIGEDTFRLITGEKANPSIELIFKKYDKKSIEGMGWDDKYILQNFKSSYLGTSKPKETEKERNFLGSKVIGEIQNTKIPKKKRIEAYLISLPNGNKLGFATRSNPEIEENVIDKMIQSIETTLVSK